MEEGINLRDELNLLSTFSKDEKFFNCVSKIAWYVGYLQGKIKALEINSAPNSQETASGSGSHTSPIKKVEESLDNSQEVKSANKSINGLRASGTKSPILPTTEQSLDTIHKNCEQGEKDDN